MISTAQLAEELGMTDKASARRVLENTPYVASREVTQATVRMRGAGRNMYEIRRREYDALMAQAEKRRDVERVARAWGIID